MICMKNYKGLLRCLFAASSLRSELRLRASARNDGENLCNAHDLGYINRVEREEASELAMKVSKMLSNFIAYLSSVKRVKG